MNSYSKYTSLLKTLVQIIVALIIIGVLNKIISLYYSEAPDIFETVRIIFGGIKTVLIMLLIVLLVFLSSQIARYFNSVFYRIYRVNIFEALYHGIMDIHIVYDQVQQGGVKDTDITVNLQTRMIVFDKHGKSYALYFADIMGIVSGNPSWDEWSIRGAKFKQDGRVNYKTKAKFPNPINALNKNIASLKTETGKEYNGYVVMTGFYKLGFSSPKIILPYEIPSVTK
ncbi:MAG: hypothetical protein AB7U79_04560 [Candidatus Izemoplasmatales bacterium]